MVGGDAESFARAQPVLEVIGSNAVHVGKSGDGQRVKLVNQIPCDSHHLGALRSTGLRSSSWLGLRQNSRRRLWWCRKQLDA